MSWLLIVILLCFVIAGFIGWKLGFAKMLISLFAVVIAVVLTWLFAPMIKDLLTEHTSWDESLATKLEETILKDADGEEMVETVIGLLPLPAESKDEIRTKLQPDTDPASRKTALAAWLSDIIFSVGVTLVFFVVALILVLILGKVIGLVDRIPVLKQVNGALGMIFALVIAFVFLNLFFLVILLFGGTGFSNALMTEIHKSQILTWLYEHNLLLFLFKIVKQKLFGA